MPLKVTLPLSCNVVLIYLRRKQCNRNQSNCRLHIAIWRRNSDQHLGGWFNRIDCFFPLCFFSAGGGAHVLVIGCVMVNFEILFPSR